MGSPIGEKDYESQYLQHAVGHVLPDAMAAAITGQPEDPVEFVANYLLKFLENQEKDKQVFSLNRFTLYSEKKKEKYSLN